MIRFDLQAPRSELRQAMLDLYPAWPTVDQMVRRHVGPANKKEVWEEQAIAIAALAAQYNRHSAAILEIGANRGYTAGIMAIAAPEADVTTLEPHRARRQMVRRNVGSTFGVHVRPEQSTAWLLIARKMRRTYNLIFVDGDHARVALDLPYYNLLKRGGLFLHHDYSRPGSARECPPVWEALNDFAERLDHPPDVLLQDDTGVGLAGWYKKAGEEWPW